MLWNFKTSILVVLRPMRIKLDNQSENVLIFMVQHFLVPKLLEFPCVVLRS